MCQTFNDRIHGVIVLVVCRDQNVAYIASYSVLLMGLKHILMEM